MTGVVPAIRVAVAEDQALVRSGFVALLRSDPDLEVVGEADDGLAALEVARRTRPDVMLMDIRMPGLDGVTATGRLTGDPATAGVRVLILTTFDADQYVHDALRAGPAGSCSRTSSRRTCSRRQGHRRRRGPALARGSPAG